MISGDRNQRKDGAVQPVREARRAATSDEIALVTVLPHEGLFPEGHPVAAVLDIADLVDDEGVVATELRADLYRFWRQEFLYQQIAAAEDDPTAHVAINRARPRAARANTPHHPRHRGPFPTKANGVDISNPLTAQSNRCYYPAVFRSYFGVCRAKERCLVCSRDLPRAR